MPMLDAYIPEGALPPETEERLIARLTDLLLSHEGVDPENPQGRRIAWVFVHRPVVYAAGARVEEPHYKFVCQVPEPQYDDERRAAVTAEMTQAVAEAEAGKWPDPEGRVWVFTHEVPDGNWGGRGRVHRLPDIAEVVLGREARGLAEQALAERRRQTAVAIIDAAGDRAHA
jgi:phenylpyruvate tautomerase PptA (4-oxalocrotonate tautomerase family)